MTTLTYGTFDSSDIVGLRINHVRRPIVGEDRDVWIWIPGRDDPVVFPQPRGARTVTAECSVIGDDYIDRRAIIREIAAELLDQITVVELAIDDEPVVWQARLGTLPEPDEVATLGEFELEFNVYDPVEAS